MPQSVNALLFSKCLSSILESCREFWRADLTPMSHQPHREFHGMGHSNVLEQSLPGPDSGTLGRI